MAGTDVDIYGVPLSPDPTRCKLHLLIGSLNTCLGGVPYWVKAIHMYYP